MTLEINPADVAHIPVQGEQAQEQIVGERSFADKLRTAGLVAIIGAEVTPLNEVIRGTAFAVTAGLTNNSTLGGALSLGVSTLVIEGAAALASASLYEKGGSKKAFSWINTRLRRSNVVADTSDLTQETQFPRFKKAARGATAAFLGGSAVAIAVEQSIDPSRKAEQNRRFGLTTAAWLAGVCAVGGAFAAEGIDIGLENPLLSAGVVAGAGIAVLSGAMVRSIRNHNKAPRSLKNWRIDTDKFGDSYGIVTDAEQLEKAAVLEQAVWDENDFGNLEEEGYGPHIANSLTFAAFDANNECTGVNRMFGANEELVPPFLDMEFYDESKRAELIAKAKAGLAEELGTVAVPRVHRGKGKNLRLWRLAYRNARERGIEEWGIIMEPERVEKMNKHQGFVFRQLGPTEDYQGGDCAPFVMNLQEVDDTMKRKHPINYWWFVRKSLKK